MIKLKCQKITYDDPEFVYFIGICVIVIFRDVLLGTEWFCTNFLFISLQYTSGMAKSPWFVSTIDTVAAPKLTDTNTVWILI